jgi:hypothetical protein
MRASIRWRSWQDWNVAKKHTVWLPLVSGPPGSAPLRIGTQNLGLDETERAASLVGDIVRRYDLDIFAMQEVYRWPLDADDHKPLHVPTIRAQLPGWHFHEGPGDVWMINMTASKYPIIHAETVRIEDRHLLETTIRTPDGDLTVYNWHAKRDAGTTYNACRYNKAAFRHIRERAAGKQYVFVGDFNLSPPEKLWDKCKPGAESVIQRTKPSEPESTLWTGLWGPQIVGIEQPGNVHKLQDAHELYIMQAKLQA